MPKQLIALAEDVFAEVEPAQGFEEISFGISPAKEKIELLEPFLLNLSRPVLAAWRELQSDDGVSEAEMSLGVGFTAHGNLYIARSEARASLQLKIVLRRAEPT